MPLLTQAFYARRHGVSRQALNRYVRDGIIRGHGPRKLINPAEADGCWVPRSDAGMPQLRAGDPAAEAAMARAMAADGWLEWADRLLGLLAAAGTMAELRRVLHAALDQRLRALGLVAAVADDQGDGRATP